MRNCSVQLDYVPIVPTIFSLHFEPENAHDLLLEDCDFIHNMRTTMWMTITTTDLSLPTTTHTLSFARVRFVGGIKVSGGDGYNIAFNQTRCWAKAACFQ